MCTKYLRKSQPKTMQSLLTKCLDNINSNLDLYTNDLPFLPAHIKNRILKSLTSRLTNFNIKQNVRMLVHSELQQIDFRYIDIDDEFLEFISRCSNLKALILTRSHKNSTLTENGLLGVLPNFKQLRIFDAPNCPAVTDRVVRIIVDNCTRLSGLDISGCKNISDVALFEISKLEHLNALSVSRTQITNGGIVEFLHVENMHRLKELRIAECSNITHDSINLICQKCTALEIFIFYNCEQVNDQETVNAASENLKQLKQLSWSVFCTAF